MRQPLADENDEIQLEADSPLPRAIDSTTSGPSNQLKASVTNTITMAEPAQSIAVGKTVDEPPDALAGETVAGPNPQDEAPEDRPECCITSSMCTLAMILWSFIGFFLMAVVAFLVDKDEEGNVPSWIVGTIVGSYFGSLILCALLNMCWQSLYPPPYTPPVEGGCGGCTGCG